MAYSEVRQLGSAACFVFVLGAHYDQTDYVSIYASWYNRMVCRHRLRRHYAAHNLCRCLANLSAHLNQLKLPAHPLMYLPRHSVPWQEHHFPTAQGSQSSPQIAVWCFFGAHDLCIVSHCAFRCELKIPACLAALRQVLLLFKLQHKQRNNIGPSIVLGRYICSFSNVDLQS